MQPREPGCRQPRCKPIEKPAESGKLTRTIKHRILMTSLQSALQGLKLAPTAPAAPAPVAALSGSVSPHPNGFGFILDTEGNSHFVPPFLMKQFIPGDIVSFTEAA